MAHSWVEFRGKNLRIHDLDLAVSCFVIIEAAGAANGASCAMFADWLDSISSSGAGCILLDLDDHLTTSGDVEEFRELITGALSEVLGCGEFYPRDRIERWCSAARIALTRDYRADLIARTLDGLRALVSEPDVTER